MWFLYGFCMVCVKNCMVCVSFAVGTIVLIYINLKLVKVAILAYTKIFIIRLYKNIIKFICGVVYDRKKFCIN